MENAVCVSDNKSEEDEMPRDAQADNRVEGDPVVSVLGHVCAVVEGPEALSGARVAHQIDVLFQERPDIAVDVGEENDLLVGPVDLESHGAEIPDIHRMDL
jgi:hypothetical protein